MPRSTAAPENTRIKPQDLSRVERDRLEEARKDQVNAAQQLTRDVKRDLQEICEKAAAGQEDAVAEGSLEVCKKLIEQTLPQASAREQAIDACTDARGR